MNHLSLMLIGFCSMSLHLFSLFTLSSLWFTPNMIVFALENETDHLALIKFKEFISDDPDGILLSWNTSTHFCNWYGIICNHMNQRVTELNLEGYKLKGYLSTSIGNLSYVRNLNLGDNNFYGKIPQELGRLSQLQQLSLGNNSFVGKIPTNLSGCPHLKSLLLGGNKLVGKIPTEIGSLLKLQFLALFKNHLVGGISSFIGNLSSITDLSVSKNNLEGGIPQEICHLKSLSFFSLGVNNLTGTFPSCLYNMSSLTTIAAPQNHFSGSLPANMFLTLPNLQQLEIGQNQFSGHIPPSITNASTISLLDISENYFIGQVPSLGTLQDLYFLNLGENNLGNNLTNDLEFLDSLTNSTKLKILAIPYNNFGGHLSNSLGNLSTQLSQLYLGYNHISGEIPETIGNLIGLTLLSIYYNNIEGVIPTTFGKFQKMQMLGLNGNKLSGEIGAFIGNLSMLFYLGMAENMLEGNIPPNIGNCQKLQHLNLSQNNFTGIIPLDIFSLSTLTYALDVSRNSLSGSIPEEVGNLKNLGLLDISENNLSGDIPTTIGECIMLEYIYLQGNSLQGVIPSSLGSLKGLQRLDLSRNRLSGSIPYVLQNISLLEYFNISFNMLDGEVPAKGVFQNVSGIVVTGNDKLCGGIFKLHLPPCPIKGIKQAKHQKLRLVVVIVSIVVFLLTLSIILTICWKRKKSKKSYMDSPTIEQLSKVSYHSLHNGTNGFSTSNLIGCGNFSSVYKGTLELKDKVVAIKVLKLQRKGAHKSFIVECNALKNIKHRNLVQMLTCCSSIDYKGQEFKALIFEYMKNGSLEHWLHPHTLNPEHPRTLSLHKRLNIIIDIASALHYLHYECDQSIIHCDLKPSNVLLDDDMIAHVSDFGISRLISTINSTFSKQTSTIGIKGTIGYAPPEYGVGSEVSINGDVYSFGILVMEILTGKRPTDEIFENDQNLHIFVEKSLPDNLLHILDPSLVPKHGEETIEEETSRNLSPRVEKCLVSLFKVGLACSIKLPKERLNMGEVTKELSKIKDSFLVDEDT